MRTSGNTDSLGETVRARRRQLGLDQMDVAALAGVSQKFLSQLENDKPTVQLAKVRAVLGVLGLELRAVPTSSDDA